MADLLQDAASMAPDERALTSAEARLARRMFGSAIRYDSVRICQRKWWPLQPRNVVMAPRGHIHFHPAGGVYTDCFAQAPLSAQGLFVHELTHVWQHQSGINLLTRRHPFCRYDYVFVPGKPFPRYGIEQQAEIVRHVLLLQRGQSVPGKPPLDVLAAILPFGPPAGDRAAQPV